jgi:hypothetical protein
MRAQRSARVRTRVYLCTAAREGTHKCLSDVATKHTHRHARTHTNTHTSMLIACAEGGFSFCCFVEGGGGGGEEEGGGGE